MKLRFFLISITISLCFLITGCSCNRTITPTATSDDETPTTSGTLTAIPEPETLTLSISQWEYANSLYTAAGNIGENWVALARPVPPPYTELDMVKEFDSNRWILITPNNNMKNIKFVQDADSENNVLATRAVDQLVVTASPSRDDLFATYRSWYDDDNEVTESVLWIDALFAEETGTMYAFGPTSLATLTTSPYTLDCPPTSDTCIIKNRFTGDEMELNRVIDATQENDYDFRGVLDPRRTIDSILYLYAECDIERNRCVLFAEGAPGPGDTQTYICGVLGCNSNYTYVCRVYGCSN